MTVLSDLVDRLARVDVSSWSGVPAGLAVAGPAAALELGDDHVPAEMVHLEGSARAWSRDGAVVLLDVALAPAGEAAALDALGSPDSGSVRYGLAWADERVYGERGLAAIVDTGSDVVRHLLGFAPGSADEYRRSLRPGFGSTRRPLEER